MSTLRDRLSGGALLCLLLIVASAHASASVEQLPEWAQRKWNSLAKTRSLEPSLRMNPFVWRGDFDGDGAQDIALFLRASASGKEGIALLLRNAEESIVVGAGSTLGNGGDDFSWLDFWTVVEGDTSRPIANPARGDRLFVAKQEAASAQIYLQNGKPRWQQAGD